MKLKPLTIALLCALSSNMAAKESIVEITVLQTSDVHGCFFPYDFINRKPMHGSMARVSSYVKAVRKSKGNNVLLLDNGDILQGQPTCYYCNYIKPDMPNIAAEVVNYMGYDAQTIGNHDVETGHAVYDKWASEVKCPMLGANVIDTSTGKPYFKPYAMFMRDGVRIAVIGMLTPAIPNWLNIRLWEGMCFQNIVETAAQWVEYVKAHEHPDVIIGLFHSGLSGGITTDAYEENAALRAAKSLSIQYMAAAAAATRTMKIQNIAEPTKNSPLEASFRSLVLMNLISWFRSFTPLLVTPGTTTGPAESDSLPLATEKGIISVSMVTYLPAFIS